jgi:hypothetical protein
MLDEPVAALFAEVDTERYGASTVKRSVRLPTKRPELIAIGFFWPYARDSKLVNEVSDSHCVDSHAVCPRRLTSVEAPDPNPLPKTVKETATL